MNSASRGHAKRQVAEERLCSRASAYHCPYASVAVEGCPCSTEFAPTTTPELPRQAAALQDLSPSAPSVLSASPRFLIWNGRFANMRSN